MNDRRLNQAHAGRMEVSQPCVQEPWGELTKGRPWLVSQIAAALHTLALTQEEAMQCGMAVWHHGIYRIIAARSASNGHHDSAHFFLEKTPRNLGTRTADKKASVDH